jgi:hypothetical protein
MQNRVNQEWRRKRISKEKAMKLTPKRNIGFAIIDRMLLGG